MFEKDCCYCVNSVSLGELSPSKLNELLAKCSDSKCKLRVVALDGNMMIQFPDCFLSKFIKNGGLK